MGPKGYQNGTPFWSKRGPKWDPFLVQKGVPFWSPFGPERGPLLVPVWTKRGSHFGPLLDPLWIHFGSPLGSLVDPKGAPCTLQLKSSSVRPPGSTRNLRMEGVWSCCGETLRCRLGADTSVSAPGSRPPKGGSRWKIGTICMVACPMFDRQQKFKWIASQ